MADFAQFGNDLYTGRRSVPIVPKRRFWYIFSLSLIVISLLALGVRGLNPSIEFRGGSEFIVSGVASTAEAPAIAVVKDGGGTEPPRISVLGNNAVRVQTERLTNDQTSQIREGLAEAYDVPLTSVASSFVGPSWGADVTGKAVQALIIFLALVAVVMTLYFRTWTMAAASLLALLQDIILTVGLYAIVGFEVSPATVIGFLTILGYSLYDTVVVFDKVRENTENFRSQTRRTYGELANLAVNQTLVRSINTSVVALLPIGSILFIGAFILGAGTLRDIALVLFVGVLLGTFSSVFIATPLEVDFYNRRASTAAHTKRVLDRRAEREAARQAGGDDAGDEADSDEEFGSLLATPGVHRGVAAQPRRKSRNRARGR